MDAAFESATDYKSYQFRPLLKFFGDAKGRLLIADEAGLGKTIEAGYIVVESVARGLADRIGVLCPSRLKSKWASELWQRFGLRFAVLESGNALSRALGPSSNIRRWIASVDLARQLDVDSARPLAHLDLLVIDEVHGMIGREHETMRRSLGRLLSEHSTNVVALSATPVQLDIRDLGRVFEVVSPGLFSEEAFSHELALTAGLNSISRLLSKSTWTQTDAAALVRETEGVARLGVILGPDETLRLRGLLESVHRLDAAPHDEVRYRLAQTATNVTRLSRHIIRSRSAEVGEDRRRDVSEVAVKLDSSVSIVHQDGQAWEVSEQGVYDALDGLFREAFSLVHRAQLSSSLPAIAGLLSSGERGVARWEATEELDEDQVPTDGAVLSSETRGRCAHLANLHRTLPTDSKYAALRRGLQDLQFKHEARKALVFTHWIPTHSYLASRLRIGTNSRLFIAQPGSDDDELGETLQSFRDYDGFAVLLTTDLLREGFDLDAADAVVNYDLPFNPQVLEQRIGRVDRVSQKSRILRVLNIVVQHSLDSQILHRIHERVGSFERALGRMRPIDPKMMVELQQTGDISAAPIARVVAEEETEKRLLDHGVFQGVETALDDEIQRVHRERGSGGDTLLWLVMSRFFSEFLDPAQISWEPESHTLDLGEVPSTVREAIAILAGRSERAPILEALRRFSNGDGKTRFRLPPGAGGIPLRHPLLQLALNTVERQESSGPNPVISPGRVRLPFGQLDAVPDASLAGLLEFSMTDRRMRERGCKWFVVDSSGAVHVESALSTAQVLLTCLRSGVTVTEAEFDSTREAAVTTASSAELERWRSPRQPTFGPESNPNQPDGSVAIGFAGAEFQGQSGPDSGAYDPNIHQPQANVEEEESRAFEVQPLLFVYLG
ncbi:MAG: DEAD/DEAH box helicase [Thermoplasmata archaeon]|nr:DEAD/DEAH box helicase [Thermoplasmata archaeon]